MLRLAADRGGTVELAVGVDEIKGIQQVTTLVALVTTGVIVMASRALSLHVSISQERAVRFTKRLLCRLLREISVLIESLEDDLRNLGVLLCRSSAKVIEPNVKPIVDFFMNLVVFGTQLLGRHLLFEGLCLCRSSIFVGTADVESRSSASLVISTLYYYSLVPIVEPP